MSRLLTEKERDEILSKPLPEHYRTYIEIMAEAQDAKTLKAVGEWLQKSCISLASLKGHSPIGVFADDCHLCQCIKGLLQGKMPDE